MGKKKAFKITPLLDADDALADAKNLVDGILLAASGMHNEEADPLQMIAGLASDKIKDARSLVHGYVVGVRKDLD